MLWVAYVYLFRHNVNNTLLMVRDDLLTAGDCTTVPGPGAGANGSIPFVRDPWGLWRLLTGRENSTRMSMSLVSVCSPRAAAPLIPIRLTEEPGCRSRTNRWRRSPVRASGRQQPLLPQHLLYFNPLPQGQGSLRPIPAGFFFAASIGITSPAGLPCRIRPAIIRIGRSAWEKKIR